MHVLFYIVPALIVVLLVVYVIIESSGFRCVEYTLETDKTDKDLKIAMICDLHNKDYGNENEALIETIDAFHPDFVCFAGDMVTSGWDVSFNYQKTLGFMKKLAAKYPIYYGFGNHEQNFNEDRKKFPHEFDDLKKALEDMQIPLLDNERIVLDRYHTVICGLNLEYDFYRGRDEKELTAQMIEERLGKADKERYVILLAHNPVYFKEYAKWGADLVLSGHVHGGIVSLPFIGGLVAPGFKLFPKYDAGLFREDQTDMVLSRGAGYHSVPVRINNKAEIVCLTVKGVQHESECETAGV